MVNISLTQQNIEFVDIKVEKLEENTRDAIDPSDVQRLDKILETEGAGWNGPSDRDYDLHFMEEASM